MSAVELVLLCTGGFVAVGVLAVGAGRRAGTAVYAATLGLSLAACIGSLAHLISEPDTVSAVVLPLGLPWLGAHFRVDALAAFFLTVVNLGAAAASLYGIGYGRHEETPGRVLAPFSLFIGAMNLVVVADDAFTFLFTWELMSLASWALVLAHHESADNARAGFVYLVMASFGTLALLLGFGLLAGPDGDYAFDAMRAAEHGPVTTGLALALVLLGAGSKSGLVPLHAWLPLAHPAAPSHVSALMSGVMTKVAIYGFVRIVFDLIGEPAAWQSMVVLAAGGATAVLGVLYALMQRDLKRLLAYSTVENVGIVYIGLGLSLAFAANGFDTAAALALTAALFHVLNHSLFKSLLFFGAGAVLTATGERDMEKLGGLIRRMPATSFVFLVGCVAISALPPLNGFVSEWLTFQAVLQSPDLPQWGLKLMVPAIGGLLALAAALAAACFVRAFGITFLGRPRSPVAASAHGVERSSLAAMIGLAVLCVAAGILPGTVIDAVSPITLDLLGGRLPAQADIAWRSIVPVAETESSYSGLLVFVFIAITAPLAAAVIKRFASNAVRRGPAWDCGFPDPSPLTQYSAGSFEQPIRRVFGTTLFAATERVDMPKPGDLRPARLEVTVRDPIWETLYEPVMRGVGLAADRLNRMQFLTIRRYLTLVFLSLVGLLLVLVIWQT